MLEKRKPDQREERSKELQRALLLPSAVPSSWPNYPEYLSQRTESRRTCLATSEARDEAVAMRRVEDDEKEAREGISFESIVKRVNTSLPFITVIRESSTLGLFSISLSDTIPHIR